MDREQLEYEVRERGLDELVQHDGTQASIQEARSRLRVMRLGRAAADIVEQRAVEDRSIADKLLKLMLSDTLRDNQRRQ